MLVIRIATNLLELIAVLLIWSKFMEEVPHKLRKNIIIVGIGAIESVILYHVESFSAVIVLLLLLLIKLFIIYRISMVETIIKLIITYALVFFVEFALLVALSSVLDVGNSHVNLFMSGILVVIICTIYFTKILDRFFSSTNQYFAQFDKGFNNLWVINTLLYCVCVKFIWELSPGIILANKFFVLFIYLMVYILNFYIYKNDVIAYEKEKMEEYYNKYSPVMTNMMEDIRSKQHEFKNFMNTIYGIVQVSEDESLRDELERYISSINKSFKRVDYVKCENNLINAIVYGKVIEAKKKNILFRYSIQDVKRLPIEEYEMSEILANLLNNAIEAVEESQDTHPFVILNIRAIGCHLKIDVTNSGKTLEERDIPKIFKKGFSTKNRGSGYGLYNIRQIIQDESGDIDVIVNDDVVTFSVTLPRIKGIETIL